MPLEISRPLEGASAFSASQVFVDDPFRGCVNFLAMNLQLPVVDEILPASHASRVGFRADDSVFETFEMVDGVIERGRRLHQRQRRTCRYRRDVDERFEIVMHESGERLRVGFVATLKLFVDQTPSLLFISFWKHDAMNDFYMTANDVGEFGRK